ncbi:MAG: hypothetical protein PVH61_22905 [Candidatus Aminicenantes bacterium]
MDRPLSAGEHLLWLIDRAVPQNFVMAARLSLLSGELIHLPSLLRQALDILKQRYPSLNCKIKKGKTPEFVTTNVPKMPLRIIQRKGDDHWVEESEKEMLKPLPRTRGPMVRAVLMEAQNQWDLLMTFCHLTTDATSGVKFLKHLLTITGRISRGEIPAMESPLPGLPPVDDLLREEVKQRAQALAKEESTDEQALQPVDLQGDREVPVEQRITRIIPRQLTKAQLKTLMVRSRKERATVHTAFCAALLQTMVEQIRLSQPVPQKGPLLMGCISAVNIRHLFKQPPGNNLGNFISNALHYQLIDDGTSLWEAARRTKKSLQAHLEAGQDINMRLAAGSLLKPNETPIELITRLKDLFPPTGVTNMGQLDIPGQFGNLLLENLHYNPSINPSIKNGFGLSVSAFGNYTTLNFLYAEPFISKERARQMVESTMNRLKQAVLEGHR